MLDFRNQVIYYIVIDRFFENDSLVDFERDPNEFDQTKNDWSKYWGGNLQGLIDKLDYLKEMGVTSVWVSPIFELNDNIKDFESRGSNKFYGYWPKDFKRINKSFVNSLSDTALFDEQSTVFDRLIEELHKRNMKLVLDINCNYSTLNNKDVEIEICDNGESISNSHDNFSTWMHNYDETLNDWQNKWQVENQKKTGLGKFNEYSFGFRDYLKSVMKAWIDKSVDSFALNTTKNMPNWFWQEIISEIRSYKSDFFVFGDWYKGGCFDDHSINYSNRTAIPILDYSLNNALINCFVRNNPSGFYLIDDIFKKDGKFKSATQLITFIDNNIGQRFLSMGASLERLELAVNLIMTCRGIPMIFYGLEQYLHDNFMEGYEPFNRPMMKNWDQNSVIFQNIKNLSKLRKENIAIQRGYQQTRYITENIFVFTRKYGDNYCVVGMNKGAEKTFDIAGIEMPDGIYDDILSDMKVTIENNKIIQINLKQNDTFVISKCMSFYEEATMVTFQLNGFNTHFGQIVKIIGNCPELGCWDVEKAPVLQYINSNTWMGDVAIKESAGKIVYYKYLVINHDNSIVYECRIARHRTLPLKGHEVWKNEWI